MPCCTYLDDCRVEQIRKTLTDEYLRELLNEANALDDGGWLIGQYAGTVGRLWWRREIVRFTLYWHTVSTEYQVIHLVPSDGQGGVFPFCSTRSAIGSFLLGYIGGRRRVET